MSVQCPNCGSYKVTAWFNNPAVIALFAILTGGLYLFIGIPMLLFKQIKPGHKVSCDTCTYGPWIV